MVVNQLTHKIPDTHRSGVDIVAAGGPAVVVGATPISSCKFPGATVWRHRYRLFVAAILFVLNSHAAAQSVTPPEITTGGPFNVAEGTTSVATLTATDPDMTGVLLTWSIPSENDGGADAAHFTLSSSGALAFGTAKDYEKPDDADGDGVYEVTVQVSNGAITQTDVTITLTNVDEAGSVSTRPDQPRINTVLRARLSDPDGDLDVSAVDWQWQKSSDGQIWDDIGAATNESYTPGVSDVSLSLRATATYTDGEGSGKSAVGTLQHTVADEQLGPYLSVATLVSGLSHPWDIAFTPDGTMLFTERPGTLSSRLSDGTVQTVTADFGDLFHSRTVGLNGIVVDPGFTSNRRFYTTQGHEDSGNHEVQVVAWTIDSDYRTATRVADPLVSGMPTGGVNTASHAGSRLRFGPQGYLWIATGDGYDASTAQNLNSLGGKVLRVDAMTGDGAPTNPVISSPLVYSYGHRNPQGLDLRPGSSQMWLVEHGPDYDDEINLLTADGNYGWNPTTDRFGNYREDVPMTDRMQFPNAVEAKWSSGYPTVAPSGAIFLKGEDWGAWEGRLAVANLKDQSLRIFEFSSNGKLVSEVVVPELTSTYGRLRTPMLGPDGALYIATAKGSNDQILKISPSRPPAFPSTTVTQLEVPETGAPDSVVATIRATDPDSETLTYTLSGLDAANFKIADPSVGQVRAAIALDYETKRSYEVTVTATDPYGLSDSVTLTITVTNVEEPRVTSFTSDAMHPTKDPFTVTITFSAAVTDLTANEITVTSGTGSNFSGSGTTYRLRVTPDANFEGNVTVSLPAEAAKDDLENGSEAGSAMFAVDTIVPQLAATDASTANGAILTLTFDETLASANTPTSAFAVTGGTTRSISGVSVNGATVQLTIAPPALHGETGIEVDYRAPTGEALADAAGNKVASFHDRTVPNETPATMVSTEVGLALDTFSVTEGDRAKTAIVTGTLNRSARPTATDVTVEVGATGDTATEGTDYTTVDDLTLTIPAYATSATVRFTLTPSNDRIDERDEALTMRGSTTASGLSVTPAGGLTIGIADNDEAPSLALSVDTSSFAEDGGTATVTVGTGSGSTFETAQTVSLSVAGTATETTDYTVSGKTLTLGAGMGTGASTVSATLTGVDDDVDDDDETVVVSGTHNGVAFGDRRTVTIEDDDDPEVTVSFSQAEYRAAEGGHIDVTVTLSAVPERQVAIPVEAEGADGAEGADFSISPASLSFRANETTKTVRVSAANDSAVDPGESVALSFGTPLPDRVSEGSTAQATVTIRDEDFTFVPAFAARSGTTEPETGVFAADEDGGALRLTLELATPRGVRVEDIPDPVVVTLAPRENAGTREADEDFATQRRSGTFGDYGGFSRDLSFAPADFSDDGACGCGTAEKSVSVDLFDDRVHERTEVFGLRLSRKSGRLSVSSQDVTIKIEEDDAEPTLTLGIDPGTIAEAGGTSTVTVSTGTGSTFPTAQTIGLELSGTATEDSDFEIDTKRLTLSAGTGTDTSTVTTTVRGLDDAIDDDAETIVLSAVRDGSEFANRTLTITDDDAGSTRVDLAVNPARVREDGASATVRVTASLNAGARTQDTEVSVTVGSGSDSAAEGTDYETVGTLTLTIDAGDTEAETTFTLRPTNDDTAEGAERITVDGSVSGLAVRSATLTLNDDDVETTEVVLTLDPDEVGEAAGSRAVRITGALNGGALTTNTLVAVTVGAAADTAVEGTDYTEVGELELSIPANRTDGSVTFTLRPTNDATAEGEETISVSGDTAGLTVVPAELVLADNDAVSTRLALSLRPTSVSEGAAPTDVTVTGTLEAGARETETLVTLTVGAPADSAVSDTDYVAVSNRTLTIPANETRAETTFTLTPEDDAIAEGAESITVDGSTNGLTVQAAALTLSDNDTASRVVMLTVDPHSVREDTPEQVTATAGLDAAARVEDTTVRLTVGAAGDTAVPGTDYRRVDDRELTISAGKTAATATFFLEPLDNESADGARALRVTGTTPAADLRVEPAAGARVELEDDDIPAVLVMPAELTVTEAASADYQVVLQTAPTADVTVGITGVSGDLSLNKTSLVFAPGNFDVAQTVSVTAADDADNTQDADVTLTHRASGGAEYRGLSAELVVSIRENDPSLVFSERSVSVPEGGMAEYTVALAIEPSANVTVLISGVSGDLSLIRTDLEFTRGNWDNAQPVIVEAAEDDDSSTDPRVTLTHRASGGGYDGIVGSVQVSVTEKDGGGGAGGGGGGGGGGGAANHPPVVEREIEDQTLDVGEVLELDIRLNFYDRDQRALDYTAESADPSVATAAVDRNGLVTIRGIKRGVTAVTVTAADRRDEQASDTFAVTVRGPAFVALFPRAADPALEGFARVINHGAQAGEVSIEAVDDTGARLGPVTLAIEAGATVHFNSGDLEDGNAAKGLPVGVGSGEGDWRLVLSSELDFEALSYIRTQDGFLTAMHDTVPVRDGAYDVAIFNPGSNSNQVSRLRLINPGDAAAEVTVTGIDDAGASPGTSVKVEIPAGESLTLPASDLEAGIGVEGALGDGTGKWQLQVTSNERIVAMSLLSSPTGHLTNLSTVPVRPGDEDGTQVVPLFPSASDPLGRQGFVRVVNRSTEAGAVRIAAYDDSDFDYEDATLSIGAGATVHFNSNDLELGNAAKGLSGSTGAGVGDWRLALSSELNIQVLAYIRTSDGFLTSMHDVAPRLEGVYRVAIFNPGSNQNQVSGLRLVNPGLKDAKVTITGIDDAGASPGSAVVVTVPAGASRTILAAELESGGDGLRGALGKGVGKWRLWVESEEPIVVMSLLSSPTGHLTNLSTAPDRGGL